MCAAYGAAACAGGGSPAVGNGAATDQLGVGGGAGRMALRGTGAVGLGIPGSPTAGGASAPGGMGGAGGASTGGSATTGEGTEATGGTLLASGGSPGANGEISGTSGLPGTDGMTAGGAVSGGGVPGTGGFRATGGWLNAGAAPAGGMATGGLANTGAAPSGGTATGGLANTGAAPSGGTATGGLANTGAAPSGGSQSMGEAGGTGGGSTDCLPPALGSKGTNPLFTDQHTADPAPLVHNCTFYITCGHDEGQTGFVMREWFLLKSSDMVNWTKTVQLKLSDFSWADANAWAGQMVAKDGKFYWYVPVNKINSGMAIGVAVADSPEGPFSDGIGDSLVDDAFEMSNMGFATPSDTVFTIDPTVLVDDDGQAYLHYGGFGRMVVAKLGSDMLSIEGKMQESTPQGFFEAPYLIKRSGQYYEIYARDSNPAKIDWAISDSPMGPWTYGGRILDSLPNVPGQDAATNHAGVAGFAGQWYIVYHLSNGPNGGGTYKREVAVDKLTFEPDGSIQKVVPSSGLSF
ncbi:family 43 glycosylhydrolase [Myxococcota bacterium]